MKLYHGCTVITMDADRRVLPEGAVLVKGDRIAEVGPAHELAARYPEAQQQSCPGQVLLPGLINTHVHTAQCLARGFADDMEIMPWLQTRVWPLIGNYTEQQFLASARLNIAEMLLAGTTTFVDPMFAGRYGMAGMVQAIEESGIRGCIGKIVMEPLAGSSLHPGLVETWEASFGGALQAHQQWQGAAGGRVEIWLAPRWTAMFNQRLLDEVRRYMDAYGMRMTIHYAESPEDVADIAGATGCSPAEFLVQKGLARPETLLVHCTYLPRADDAILARQAVSVAYCPNSTIKTGMGLCRAYELHQAGVNVSMGTDAAACNNNNDLFMEMRFGSMIQKHVYQNATLFPAQEMLELATIHGAKAIGKEQELGSIEVGKEADFVLVDTRKPRLLPMPSPVSSMVFAATGADVSAVVIAGKTIVENGRLLTMDTAQVMRDAETALAQLRPDKKEG